MWVHCSWTSLKSIPAVCCFSLLLAPLQINRIGGNKVFQTLIGHVDDQVKTVLFAELIHDTRDYHGLLQALLFIKSRLSKVDPAGGLDPVNLLPTYTYTDKDLAELNALCIALNGVG